MQGYSEDEKQRKRSSDPSRCAAESSTQLKRIDSGAKYSEERRTEDCRTQAIASQDYKGKRHETRNQKYAEWEPDAVDGVAGQPHRGNARSQRDQETTP